MEHMTITNVSIRIHDTGVDKLRGFAAVVFNNEFVVKDLKIIEGANGRFVAMPSRKGKDGHFYDIAHPLHQEFRETLERRVLQAYDEAVAEQRRKAAEAESIIRLNDTDVDGALA